ncbi:MAG: PD40 domain-containing protein [Bacteroidetes bacterium]|nr:PD40 domain-containing protein [Bacteroidota bacterium]
MKLRLLALAAFFLLAKNAPAQDAATLKKNGEDFLAIGQYRQALNVFLQSEKKQSGDGETRTNIGICYFHLSQLDSAEASLFHAFHAKKEPPPTAFLYLGKLRHTQLKFEQAADFYKKFLQNTPASHPLRAVVKDDIRRCATGLRVRRLESSAAAVVPLTDAVNSPGDEFRPLPSPSGSERLYFSANRTEGNGSDIFFTEIKDGDWSAPVPLSKFVNSTENEVALGFGESGSRLFFFRGKTQRSGTILVDTFRENATEHTLFFEEFTGPMRPTDSPRWGGDCAPFFFNDSILLFASKRAGGFGGLDLYVSTFTGSGWSEAENLGPVINSIYDETSPFLARDGRTLYFATNDVARSCGGLDLLTTTWLDWSGRWSPPVNLGLPLNSAADDEHFTFNQTGGRAFFSSSRKTGPGRRDLYVALFNPPREDQLAESSPIAFHLKPARPVAASEAAVQPPGSFFENIRSFELPVIPLPAVGSAPGEEAVQQFVLLAQLMKKYPQAEVTLALHAASGDDPVPFFAFASQTVTDLLRQEGIGAENAVLLFTGTNFPLDSSSAPENRRAEIYFANPAVLPFELYRPKLPTDAFNARFFQKTMTSLAYRVTVDGGRLTIDGGRLTIDGGRLMVDGGRLTVDGGRLTEDGGLATLFRFYPDGLLEFRPSENELLFTPGLYLTFASAEEWRKNLVRDGYREATVAAYLSGREVTKEEAARHLEDFPDLRNFIEN